MLRLVGLILDLASNLIFFMSYLTDISNFPENFIGLWHRAINNLKIKTFVFSQENAIC